MNIYIGYILHCRKYSIGFSITDDVILMLVAVVKVEKSTVQWSTPSAAAALYISSLFTHPARCINY